MTSGTGGTAVLNPDGTVTFTPNADFNGDADFTYTVTDGDLTSNTANRDGGRGGGERCAGGGRRQPDGDRGHAGDLHGGAAAGQRQRFDGDSITIASVTSGTGGTAVLNPDGTVTFTPNADFNGDADFHLTRW